MEMYPKLKALFSWMTDGFLSLVYIGSKDNVQPLCPWSLEYKEVSGPVTPESGERGLIEATLVGILVKPFEGSLFEINVRGQHDLLYLSSLVWSEVSLTRTQRKPGREQLSRSHSHAHAHAHALDTK